MQNEAGRDLPRVGLCLPLRQVENNERMRRCKAKAENFKLAAEAKKKIIEQDKSDRALRSAAFEARAADMPDAERSRKLELFQEQETKLLRAKCKVWSTQDFEPLRILGQGAFGVVHLARQRDNGRYVALKQLSKSRYKEKNLRERAFAERKILADSANRWFVELLATFQDQDHFYMVMEFLQGGDLLSHLELKPRFTEEETRFYMAELLQALDVVHKAGFVHRDVKPDNVVLSEEGHLKLLDFGLCKADPMAVPPPPDAFVGDAALTRRQRMRSARGTPQYMAPEAVAGEVCPAGDLWALGVMLYECLCGTVIFHAGHEQGPDANLKVLQQVQNHKEHFAKRLERGKRKGYVGPEAEHVLLGLVCGVAERLTAEQCRREAFFSGMDFERLHLLQPPIVPRLQLDGPADTRFFPSDLGSRPLPEPYFGPGKDAPMEWALYEFSREAHELQQPKAVEALFAPTSSHAASPTSDQSS